jgi:hypothetical protein
MGIPSAGKNMLAWSLEGQADTAQMAGSDLNWDEVRDENSPGTSAIRQRTAIPRSAEAVRCEGNNLRCVAR